MDKTNREIEQELLELPHKIWAAGSKAVQLKRDLEIDKEIAKREFHKALLKAKAENRELTAKELDAMAHVATENFRLEVISSEAVYEVESLKCESLRDRLGSLQSVIKLRVAEINSQI